jgi:hypothetical protein
MCTDGGECYQLAKDENVYEEILFKSIPKILFWIHDIKYNGLSTPIWPWPVNYFYNTGKIEIDPDFQFFKSTIAHEYGHYLLYLGFYRLGFYPFNINSEKIVYPDGFTNSTYSRQQFSLLTEGYAEFWSIVYQYKFYQDLFVNSMTGATHRYCYIENNYGSRQLFYWSVLSNENAIGQIRYAEIGADTLRIFLYEFDFPRNYREASILFDLWDNNQISLHPTNNSSMIYRTNGLICADYIFKKTSVFWQYPYNQALYLSNFTSTSIENSEMAMDKISMPIQDVFGIAFKNVEVCMGGSLDIDILVLQGASMYAINIADITNLLMLHSQDFPGYVSQEQTAN